MEYWKRIPEWECVEHGDPYFTEIVIADDIIDDHRYNAEWLGLDKLKAEAVAKAVEWDRLHYELTTLTRWWSL